MKTDSIRRQKPPDPVSTKRGQAPVGADVRGTWVGSGWSNWICLTTPPAGTALGWVCAVRPLPMLCDAGPGQQRGGQRHTLYMLAVQRFRDIIIRPSVASYRHDLTSLIFRRFPVPRGREH